MRMDPRVIMKEQMPGVSSHSENNITLDQET